MPLFFPIENFRLSIVSRYDCFRPQAIIGALAFYVYLRLTAVAHSFKPDDGTRDCNNGKDYRESANLKMSDSELD